MKAFVFPGQGAQFPGMGKDLLEQYPHLQSRFDTAKELLGFDIQQIMFEGTKEELLQTRVTQPAIFLHAVLHAEALGDDFQPQGVAGHSLGEFSALTAAGALSFSDGLQLVAKRAEAMQKACENSQGTMAAILGLEDEVVEKICAQVSGIVIPANYNCPGQLVISGAQEAVEEACEELKNKGAKRALLLPVSGAFHSPLMETARQSLASAIEHTDFQSPICPIYQNVDAQAYTDTDKIQQNLIEQLTAPVRWTQIVHQMAADGYTSFVELGPGKVLQGLIRKIDRNVEVSGA
ncbi:MAG: ACP S-malonyltransferase [Flavobacteriaceae bacterium]